MPAHAHRVAGRHTHWRVAGRRRHLLRTGLAALLAVVGPGMPAGLSDDDPTGIATYSILGARYGYELIWVLAGVIDFFVIVACAALGRFDRISTGAGRDLRSRFLALAVLALP